MKFTLKIILGLTSVGIFGMYFINFLGGTNVLDEESSLYILLIASMSYLLLGILFFIQIRQALPLIMIIIIATICVIVSILSIFVVGSEYISLAVIGFIVSVAAIIMTRIDLKNNLSS